MNYRRNIPGDCITVEERLSPPIATFQFMPSRGIIRRRRLGNAAKAQSEQAFNILSSSAEHIDGAVRVVVPLDRNRLDSVAAFGCNQQQLRVKKPVIVFNLRDNGPGSLTGQGFEPALGVLERGKEQALDQQVVAAGDGLPPERAGDSGAFTQAAADSDVIPRLQGLNQLGKVG